MKKLFLILVLLGGLSVLGSLLQVPTHLVRAEEGPIGTATRIIESPTLGPSIECPPSPTPPPLESGPAQGEITFCSPDPLIWGNTAVIKFTRRPGKLDRGCWHDVGFGPGSSTLQSLDISGPVTEEIGRALLTDGSGVEVTIAWHSDHYTNARFDIPISVWLTAYTHFDEWGNVAATETQLGYCMVHVHPREVQTFFLYHPLILK